MSDVTDKAAAVLLYKTTMDTLRICRGSNPGKSGKILALCATPELVDVMRYNATLLDALVFDYATRVAAGCRRRLRSRRPRRPRSLRLIYSNESRKNKCASGFNSIRGPCESRLRSGRCSKENVQRRRQPR